MSQIETLLNEIAMHVPESQSQIKEQIVKLQNGRGGETNKFQELCWILSENINNYESDANEPAWISEIKKLICMHERIVNLSNDELLGYIGKLKKERNIKNRFEIEYAVNECLRRRGSNL